MDALHSEGMAHLPFFITPPGETDVLMIAMGIFLLLAVVGVGILYFTIHALPEHLAHGGNKIQLQIVAVLAILALFTHNHIFWIAGLLLALIQFPDFESPLNTMASSLERIARKANGSDTPAKADEDAALPLPAPANVQPSAPSGPPALQVAGTDHKKKG